MEERKNEEKTKILAEATKMPLHRRRFDAKHRDLPNELISLPNKPDTARSFCEDLIDRMQKRDESIGDDLQPLFTRTAHTAMSALATEDALDHLDKLYRLMDQLFALKEQNFKLQRRARDLEHIRKLKEMHTQIEQEIIKTKSTDPEAFFKSEATCMDLGEEYEYTEALLDSMLAAGRNASLKRAKWKNPRTKNRQSTRSQRSKSMGGAELDAIPFETGRLAVPSSSRRSSESKEKSKISKWTRVKAAFKWEKAHTGIIDPSMAKSHSFATVPLTPISQITPASLSPASSSEDVKEYGHDLERRSRSLDVDCTLDPSSPQQDDGSSAGSKMHKTPWGKMKNIIQTRKDSVKKKQNRNSVRSCSGGRTSEYYTSDCGLSQSESAEVVSGNRTPQRKISGQEKGDFDPSEAKRTTPTLTLTTPSTEELANGGKTRKNGIPPLAAKQSPKTALKKQKSLDTSKRARSSGVQDSSDPETSSPLPRRHDSKWKKVKKAFLTPASTPSSPSRHSAFFSYEPEDIAKTQNQKYGFDDEMRKDYKALQTRLDKEFGERGKTFNSSVTSMGASSSSPSGSPGQQGTRSCYEWDKPEKKGNDPTTPCDEKLTKFEDWQKSKGINFNTSSFACVPTQAQLSEDFRKKLEEWKKLKATNSVPSYTGDESNSISKDQDKDDRILKLKKTIVPQKKEVLVQTGAGCFRFEGISRSFTRKLHEWEKSRGIAPEVSTSALLRQSLARPPLPNTRVIEHGPLSNNYQKTDRSNLRLQRSQSAGSVRDDSLPHISASASSLSLTNLDESNDLSENQLSDFGEECFDTYIEVEGKPLGTESDSDGGPGAVLVEIEDEIEETAAPLVACNPRVNPQMPIYRYGGAQERHRAWLVQNMIENTEGKVSPFTQTGYCLPIECVEKISILESGIIQLIQEESTINKLLIGRKNVKDRSDGVKEKINSTKGPSTKPSSEINNLERRLGRLVKEEEILQSSLRERIQNFNIVFDKFLNDVMDLKSLLATSNITSAVKANELIEKVENFNRMNDKRTSKINSGEIYDDDIECELNNISQCITEIQSESDQSNKKENNLCITYIVTNINSDNQFNKDEKHSALQKANLPNISNVPLDEMCTYGLDDQSDDSTKGAKKKLNDTTTKPSNATKRKTKSRQRLEREKSIHTNSDTDDDMNTITVEFPKRKKNVKKVVNDNFPISRNVSITNIEKQSNTDSGDNVFVLKLKPTVQTEQSSIENESPKTSRQANRTIVMKKTSIDNCYTPEQESEQNDSTEILIPDQLSISLPPDCETVQDSDSKSDVFVKTTRKIFSPIRRNSSGETKAVIGFDLEEIANSMKTKRDADTMPDIIVNNESKKTSDENLKSQSKSDDSQKQYPIYGSDSLNSIRSQTPSPLFLKRQFNSNISRMTGRNESDESLYQSKDIFPIRRGSGERFPNACKGSPILSRASTPGISANSLPPLPASPPMNRRDKPTKETAPSIRIMIQKYNMRLSEEGEVKPQSGGSTPPWRSPRSQERFPHDSRRTLLQSARNNPFIEREVQKSASTSHIMKNKIENELERKFSTRSGDNIGEFTPSTPPPPKKLLRGILKSSSAGSLKTSTSVVNNQELMKLMSMKNNEKEKIIPPKEESKSPNLEKKIDGTIPVDKESPIIGKKIDKNLLQLAKSSSLIPVAIMESNPTYVSSESSYRALKLKRAKEQFLASGTNSMESNSEKAIRKDRNTSSNVDLAENRLSQISFNSDTSYEANSLSSAPSTADNSHLIKSASVGMINVERDAYEKLNKKDESKGRFGLSNLASKFRKVRMRSKSKPTERSEEKDKLDTVTKLCRQSLLVNLHNSSDVKASKEVEPGGSQTDKIIVLAGKTGGAVAVSNEEAFTPIRRDSSNK